MNQEVAYVNTCYGQTISPGAQVAFVDPITVASKRNYAHGGHDIAVHGGQIKVAKVIRIVQTSQGFAEADPTFELHLDNGSTINCELVVVTDQKFKYAR
jgi:hypothetical protein